MSSTIDALRNKFSVVDERPRCEYHGEPVVKNTNGSCVECFREALAMKTRQEEQEAENRATGTWEAEPIRDIMGVMIQESTMLHEVRDDGKVPFKPSETVCGAKLDGVSHRLVPSRSSQVGCWRCKRRLGGGIATFGENKS